MPCEKIEDELINCEYCDFKTTSKQGLKTHVKRKHTNYSKEIFPRKCDLCESELKSNSDLTDHMKTHSYKCSSELNYKCEECEFWGPNEITMEVHVEKHHSEKYECGLCAFEGKNLEHLELHLVTCEIYICKDRECKLTFKTITNLKSHINDEHKTQHQKRNTNILHAQISRHDSEIISTCTYTASNFFECKIFKHIK